jgi:hypothetical protein
MSSNDYPETRTYYNTVAHRIQMLRCEKTILSSLSHLEQTYFPIQLSMSSNNQGIHTYYNTIAHRIQMLKCGETISSSLSRLEQTHFPI